MVVVAPNSRKRRRLGLAAAAVVVAAAAPAAMKEDEVVVVMVGLLRLSFLTLPNCPFWNWIHQSLCLFFNGFRAWKTEREPGKGGDLKMAVETTEREKERQTGRDR